MNEDKLLLHYYDDGLDPNERRAIDELLGADRATREDYAGLCRDLDAWRSPGDAIAPAGLEQRLRASLDALETPRVASLRPRLAPARSRRLAFGVAIAATLALGIAIGILASSGDRADPLPSEPLAALGEPARTVVPVALKRGVREHLEQSRTELAALPGADRSERLRRIADIVRQNRLFAESAARGDSEDIARVLRAFEPALLRLAADDVSPADIQRARSQLEFELDVVVTRLGSRPSEVEDSI